MNIGRIALATAVTAALALSGPLATPTQAAQPSVPGPTPGAMPNVVPSNKTPAVNDGDVRGIAQVGTTMVIGGEFTSVGGQTRNHIAAFNQTTGVLSTTFAPSVNGPVYSVIPGPVARTAYIAGNFTAIDGVARKNLALVNVDTGAVVTSFKPPGFSAKINDIVLRGNRLYLGGAFAKVGVVVHNGLASLNATTGALDPFMNVQMTGHHNSTGTGAQGPVGPWGIDVTADGSKMVVIGNFKFADGLLRDQVALIDLTGPSAAVQTSWNTTRYSPLCFSWAFDSHVRGVSFSPDGSYFVIASTGGPNPGTLCDAAARFDTNAIGTDVQPTWIAETGGDTTWAVTITDTAVYVGGHQRWANNPDGRDSAGPGAVPRPGLMALDPISGRPLQWNPGRNPAGKAVYAMLATAEGLYIGSNTDWIGDFEYLRPKIAFFPYAGGTPVASTQVGKLPGSLYVGGSQSTGQSNVLYRVNAGGAAIPSLDSGPGWSADDGTTNPLRTTGSSVSTYAPVSQVDSTVPASTPAAVFDSERWDGSSSPEMEWTFPITKNIPVQVRLYMSNRCTCTSGNGLRTFDVQVNGSTALNDVDPYRQFGDQTGSMRSVNLTVPGNNKVTVKFVHQVSNPVINAIEIVRTDIAPPPPGGIDQLSKVSFDGTTASAQLPVDNGGILWSQTRGAFMLGNTLFYGYTDGFLYSRTYDGTTFGPAVKIDPYFDAKWSTVDNNLGGTYKGARPTLYAQMPNVSGMFYAAGKLYYTQTGSSSLRWRWFTPDSGIMDERNTTVTSSVNFTDVGGMFADGGFLYYVTKSDGKLNKVSFSNGTVSGSPTVVSGPGVDGVDWRNRSLFLFAPNRLPTAAFGDPNCTFLSCDFNGGASSDPDGQVVSYSWNFGDGQTGSGETPSHNFPDGGPYNVQLTVTDNEGGTAVVTHQVTVTAPPNVLPNAAFDSQCTDLRCGFDSSTSSDPDGDVASYAWDFGDGETSNAPNPSHLYTTAGDHMVQLTVTDNDGATNSVSHQVTVADPPASGLNFVGADHSDPGAKKFKDVNVPAQAQVGDTMVLAWTRATAATWTGPTGVTGWTEFDSFTNGPVITTVWTKQVTTGALGANIRMDSPAFAQGMLNLGVYTGADNTHAITAAHAGDISKTAHTTATIQAGSGDWVVSYWVDRSDTTASWTAPAGATQRDVAIGTGTGHFDSLMADSGGPVSAGPYDGLTATTDAVSNRANMITLVLTASP